MHRLRQSGVIAAAAEAAPVPAAAGWLLTTRFHTAFWRTTHPEDEARIETLARARSDAAGGTCDSERCELRQKAC